MADIYSEDRVRTIVREEIAVISSDVGQVRKDLSKDISGIRQGLRRNDINFEELKDEIKFVLQIVTDNMKVDGRVKGHELRITDLESNNSIISSTVKIRSTEIKALRAHKANLQS